MNRNKLNYNHVRVGTLKVEKTVHLNQEYRRTTIYNRAGSIREIKNYKNDKLDGEFNTYWPNGKPHLEGAYIKGRRCGNWRSYNEKGKLILEENHKTSS